MKAALKDTYKRVYNEDGSYTMPSIPENQLEHGSYCSGRSKKGKEKFPMMDHWKFGRTPFSPN
jgi:hypothetical protein